MQGLCGGTRLNGGQPDPAFRMGNFSPCPLLPNQFLGLGRSDRCRFGDAAPDWMEMGRASPQAVPGQLLGLSARAAEEK